MKKISLLFFLFTNLFSAEVHININSMHAPFVNCTTPQDCSPLIEKLTEHSAGQVFLSCKSFFWNYKCGIALLLIGGGIILWLKKPVWFKQYAS